MRKRYTLLLALLCLFIPFLASSQISVTATAGTTGPTAYTTLKDAFDAINAGTHRGSITVSITGNTSEPAACIINASGSGSANYTTVTVKPGTGATPTISGSVSSDALVQLNGANNVTIDGSNNGTTSRNLTITNTNTSSSNVLLIGSAGNTTPIDHVIVKNTILINGTNSSTAVIVGDAGAAAGTPGYFSNISIQNNSIQKAYIGLYIYAVVSGLTNNVTVADNDLNSTGANAIRLVGIYAQGVNSISITGNNLGNFESASAEFDRAIWIATAAKNVTISDNTISNLTYTGTSSYAPIGINLSSGIINANISATNNTITNITSSGTGTTMGMFIYSAMSGVTVSGNKVSNIKNTNTSGYGASGILLAPTITTAATKLYNNFVWDVAAYGFNDYTSTDNGNGIVVDGGGGFDIDFNTVVLNMEQTLTGAHKASCLLITSNVSASGTINVRDNIFANLQTVGSANSRLALSNLATSGSAVFGTINRNDYFTISGNLSSDGTTLATSLAQVQTSLGGNANSISIQPAFAGANDMHVRGPAILKSKGSPLAGITTDIDGDTRNASTPDVGADEFVPCTTITGNTAANPTTCTGANGSITLQGFAANTAYLLDYTRDGNAVTSQSFTSNASGNIVVNNLVAGTYTNFAETGCTNFYTASVVLSDPTPPTINTTPATVTLCEGDALHLSATASDPAATISWTGPNTFTSAMASPVINGVTIANDGTYSAIARLNNCPSTPATIVATIKPKPALPVITYNNPVCAGSTLNLSTPVVASATYSWSGPNTFTSAAQAPSIGTATAAAAGMYRVAVTVNGCTSDTANTAVVIHALPAAPGVANLPICQNTTPAALTAVGTNLTWYTAANVPLGAAPVPPTTTVTTTTWYVSQKDGFGCESPTAPIIVTINPQPAAPTPLAAAAYEFCQYGTATALSATGTNLLWYNTAVSTPALGAAPTPNTNTPGPYTWYVTQTDANNCESPRQLITATIKPKPATPVPSSNSPVCVATMLNLTVPAVTNATYAWSGPNTYSNASQAPSIPNVTTLAAGTYTLTLTVNGCTSDPGNTTVVVNPLPAAPVTTNLAYCQYDNSIALTATGNNLKWYTIASGGTPLGAAPIPPTNIATSTIWYVSQTDANSCESPTAPLAVNIKPQPAPPVLLPAADYTFCQFSTATALSATGTNLLWYVAINGSGTGSYTPVTNTTGTTTVYVTQTVNGCESNKQSVDVLINAKPSKPVVVTPAVYCQNDIAVPVTAAGQNILWYTTSSTGVPTAVPPVPSTLLIDTLVYYATQSIAGCESDQTEMDVYVREKLHPAIIASRPFTCIGDTLAFTFSGKSYASTLYNWQNPMPQSTYISGSGKGPMVYRFDSSGLQVVSLVVDNDGCISDPAVINVNVHALPSLSITTKAEACPGEMVRVEAIQSGAYATTFYWTFDDAQTVSNTPVSIPYRDVVWQTPGTYNISVTGEGGGCRAPVARASIRIHALPSAHIVSASGNDLLCAGDSVALSTEYSDEYTYQWYPEQYFTTTQGGNVFATPATSANLYLAVSDNIGCKSTDSIAVIVKACCDVHFPDAFSPNGDGRNDVFRIISQGHQAVSDFAIINRWGQKVYQSNDARKGWDGTYNGVPQDIGTYYYYVKYRCTNDKDFEEKGEVVLVR